MNLNWYFFKERKEGRKEGRKKGRKTLEKLYYYKSLLVVKFASLANLASLPNTNLECHEPRIMNNLIVCAVN